MRNTFQVVIVTFFMAISGASARADNATAKDAKAMVDRAIAEIKAVGAEKAFADFSAPGGKWHDRDLYVFVNKMDGTCLAHGGNQSLIGKNLIDLKTADGQLLMQKFAEIVRTKGGGWIDYMWARPQTKQIEKKSAYVVKVPGFDGYVGSGIYK